MADFTKRRITMVDTQVRPSDVTKFPIIDAMLSVPRELFVPETKRDLAYVGGPVDLGGGRQLLDARSIGKMLNALDLTPADVVLELGCGLGYTTALLSRMVQVVVAVEENEDMARDAEATLAELGADNTAVLPGAIAEGNAKNAPYDVIVAFAGVEEIPARLPEQLKEGGRIMAIFMNGALGEVRLGVKWHGHVSWRMEFNAAAPVLPGFARAPGFVF